MSAPYIPSALSDVMLVVAGFSTQPVFAPKSKQASATRRVSPKVVLPRAGNTATGLPGNYTVGDFANHYDVNPLYNAGIDGTGSTIGIATMANFYPADAYTYWSSIGLTVSQSRITQIHVDEGGHAVGGRPARARPSLDVEQSGGVAPNANIIVYDAPNNGRRLPRPLLHAASDNLVDSLS